jgi:hypothetical protein
LIQDLRCSRTIPVEAISPLQIHLAEVVATTPVAVVVIAVAVVAATILVAVAINPSRRRIREDPAS